MIENLKSWLDSKVAIYNKPDFIVNDPISIPHKFSKKEDIEIAGFFAAIIAWGKRSYIINSANSILQRMDNSPYDFVVNHSNKDLKNFDGFAHRTFNNFDAVNLIEMLNCLIKEHQSVEKVFTDGFNSCPDSTAFDAIIYFRKILFGYEHEHRVEKHISNPDNGSAAKKINMFLRWMVRRDDCGVDFGLWKNIPTSKLMMPLDVHVGNIARKLGLLERSQNDRKAVEELTAKLLSFDANDPVKYDYAIFGAGVSGEVI